jgi:antitoxin CptB
MLDARLRWRCRRGMLELDLVLAGFLAQGYLLLNDAQKQQFDRLLDETDPNLYDWLIQHHDCPHPEFTDLLNFISPYVNYTS